MVDVRAPTKVIMMTLALVGVSDAGAQLWLGGKVYRTGGLSMQVSPTVDDGAGGFHRKGHSADV